MIGPNGWGKTTLLRHIAERKIRFPASIDVLLCEQEVETSEESAVLVVLRADIKRSFLLNEELRLTNLLAAVTEDSTNKALQAVNDDLQKQLNQVYIDLDAIGAHAAEGKGYIYLYSFLKKRMIPECI